MFVSTLQYKTTLRYFLNMFHYCIRRIKMPDTKCPPIFWCHVHLSVDIN